MPETRPARKRSAFPWRPVLLFMLGWTAVWWTVIGLLVAPVLPGGWLAVLALALAGLAPLVPIGRGVAGGAYPSAPMRLFVVRPFWYVQLFLPLVAGVGATAAIIGLPFGEAARAGRWGIGLALLACILGAIAGWLGSKRLVVRQLEVRLGELAHGLDGLRIVQLSDLHVGPHTSRRFLARVTGAVRAARPDLIAVTGDQVDDFPRDVEPYGRAFGDLSAPLGIFAVAGNHDVYAGWAEVRAGLERLGHVVLVNDAVRLERNGAAFWVAGTGDPAGTRGGARTAAPDVARTVAPIAPGELAIVLAHNPALWPALARRGAHLTLSGHTHHGQLSIPSLGWSLASPFLEHAMGAHRDGDALLYIAPGTNYWGIPFRLGALPEVTVLTLRRADDGASAIVEIEVRSAAAAAS